MTNQTNQEMNHPVNQYRTMFRSLYDYGIEAFKKYYIPIKDQPYYFYDGGPDRYDPEDPPLDDLLKKELKKIISFDEWYNQLIGEIFNGTTLNIKNLSKIIQSGNFGMSQPCGGYIHFEENEPEDDPIYNRLNYRHYLSKDDLEHEYYDALGDNPSLIVITNPSFGEEWLTTNGPREVKDSKFIHFHWIKNACVLFNDSFSDKYIVREIENEYTLLSTSEVSLFEIEHKTNNTVIQFANFHGNSDPDNLSKFTKWVNWCKEKGIHYITGDSCVTYKQYYEKDPNKNKHVKNGKTQGTKDEFSTYLQTILKNEIIAYSTMPIYKAKQPFDIVWNNDIENKKVYDEIDGRFVIELNPPFDKLSKFVPFTGREYVYALSNYKYYKIIADQNVVKLETKEFNLLSATSFLIGSFKEWGYFQKSLKDYHQNIGKRYTMLWLQIYNNWIGIFNKNFERRLLNRYDYTFSPEEISRYDRFMKNYKENYEKLESKKALTKRRIGMLKALLPFTRKTKSLKANSSLELNRSNLNPPSELNPSLLNTSILNPSGLRNPILGINSLNKTNQQNLINIRKKRENVIVPKNVIELGGSKRKKKRKHRRTKRRVRL
jgi:hypothetical protein